MRETRCTSFLNHVLKLAFPKMLDNNSNDMESSKDSIVKLTPTETALVKNLSLGKSNQQLAELHGISINTVKFHLHNIFEKLGVSNRKQVVSHYQKSNDISG